MKSLRKLFCFFLWVSVFVCRMSIAVYAYDNSVIMKNEAGETVTRINDYYETERQVVFTFDSVVTDRDEMIVYEVSRDGGMNYGLRTAIKSSSLTVVPVRDEYQQYRFFIYDKSGNELRALQGNNEYYGVYFRADPNGPEAEIKFESAKKKQGRYYVTGAMPKLSVYEAQFDDTYVSVDKDGLAQVYSVKDSLQMSFKEGEYTISVYAEDKNKKKLVSKDFPINFIYDNSADGQLSFEIKAGEKDLFDSKRKDAQLLAKDDIEVSVNGADDISGIDKIYIEVGKEKYNTDSVVLSGGLSDSISAYYIDKCGNKSKRYVCDKKILVDKSKPKVSFEEKDEEANFRRINIRLSDNDAGIGSSKIYFNEELLRSEDYNAAHEKTTSRKLEIKIPDDRLEFGKNEIKAILTDAAGNEAVSKFMIEKKDDKKPVINLRGIEDGRITASNVGLAVKIFDHNIDPKAISISSIRNYDGVKEESAVDITKSILFDKDGKYTVKVSASDLAGNLSTKSVNFTIDKSAPRISGLKKYDGKELKSFSLDTGIKDMFADETVVQYRLYLNGRDYSEEETVSKAGKYRIQVYAVDQAGNVSKDQARFVIK